ncbi:MAG: NADH:flavin oxidoreductase/NADH oxidase [Hyphomicrobiaceae bacterium]|nr:NADH:flavin oxidoreductase/NADH oxidase [Hyphomicrobiaceae bacterium]
MPSHLFSPFRLRGLELANRIVVSPMAQYVAEEGCAGPWHLVHLGNMSISGAGLLIIEATAVERDARLSPGDLGLWSDENEAALAPIIAFCRKHGAACIGLQLQHAGRKGSVTVAWEKQRHIPRDQGGWPVRSSDGIPYPGLALPTALDRAMIAQLVQSYGAAARRADRLGIDLIEIHSAHGYLLHNFLSPLSNQRQDEYGGDREGRMRFVLEVFQAVRETWPGHKPIGVRISASDWTEGGWTLDDSVALAQRLKALGCDYITASSGGAVPEQRIAIGPGYQVPFAERIRREAGIATMAVGLITEPRQAEAILASASADLIALGRGMLYNPRWPWHAAEELGEEAFYPPPYERAHPSMRRGDFFKIARQS